MITPIPSHFSRVFFSLSHLLLSCLLRKKERPGRHAPSPPAATLHPPPPATLRPPPPAGFRPPPPAIPYFFSQMEKLPTKRKEPKVQIWKANQTMEQDFIAYCIESASLNGYKGSSLKSWTSVIQQMNANYPQDGQIWEQKVLKNKWVYLRNGYVLWRPLTQVTGHGRNADGTFNFPDETWDRLNQKTPGIIKFRTDPLKHWKELEHLFEGTFAAGDERFNPAKDDDVELVEDEMNVVPDDQSDHVVELESDPYWSHLVDDTAGSLPSKDAEEVEVSPGQGSNKAAGSSQGKGKRKAPFQSEDITDITDMLKSHVASTQESKDLLKKKIEFEEEIAMKKMAREEERSKREEVRAKREEEMTKKVDAYSMEECCRIINAMKDIPGLGLEKGFLTLAKVAISASHELRVGFLSEDSVEDKVDFLWAITKKPV